MKLKPEPAVEVIASDAKTATESGTIGDRAVITAGDVVTLKSGGPDMTVTEARPGLVTAEWADGDRKLSASFPADAVTLQRRATGDA